MKGKEEGGQYYISQTCDQEGFEARKVVFSWECLNVTFLELVVGLEYFILFPKGN